jgi:hypothetical protein
MTTTMTRRTKTGARDGVWAKKAAGKGTGGFQYEREQSLPCIRDRRGAEPNTRLWMKCAGCARVPRVIVWGKIFVRAGKIGVCGELQSAPPRLAPLFLALAAHRFARRVFGFQPPERERYFLDQADIYARGR